MIAIKIAHMAETIFMGGNLGKDIDASKFGGMKIWHDPNTDHIFILHKGKSLVTKLAPGIELEPYDISDYGVSPEGKLDKQGPITKHPTHGIPHEIAAKAQLENPTIAPPPSKRGKGAQVSTPLDHVQAGLGAGKTRD